MLYPAGSGACVQVFVWHYAEANLVEQSMKKGPSWVSMVNSVIKSVKPIIDYVSISVGGDSLREWNPAPALHKVGGGGCSTWDPLGTQQYSSTAIQHYAGKASVKLGAFPHLNSMLPMYSSGRSRKKRGPHDSVQHL